MRRQLYDWMIEHRDLGLIDEPELHERAAGGPLWLVGKQCHNYEQILETADLSRRGVGQRAELLRRLADPDSAIRFWAVTGLVILQCADQAVVDAFTAALDDPAVSVRIAAADGLFRLRRYAAGLPALIAALEHPLPVTRGRAANVLDSLHPSAAPPPAPGPGALEAHDRRTGRQRARRPVPVPDGARRGRHRGLHCLLPLARRTITASDRHVGGSRVC